MFINSCYSGPGGGGGWKIASSSWRGLQIDSDTAQAKFELMIFLVRYSGLPLQIGVFDFLLRELIVARHRPHLSRFHVVLSNGRHTLLKDRAWCILMKMMYSNRGADVIVQEPITVEKCQVSCQADSSMLTTLRSEMNIM